MKLQQEQYVALVPASLTLVPYSSRKISRFQQALVPYLTRKISKSVDTRMLAGDQLLQSAVRTLPTCCHKVISIHAIAEFVIALLYLL